jgi:hypothetical protein
VTRHPGARDNSTAASEHGACPATNASTRRAAGRLPRSSTKDRNRRGGRGVPSPRCSLLRPAYGARGRQNHRPPSPAPPSPASSLGAPLAKSGSLAVPPGAGSSPAPGVARQNHHLLVPCVPGSFLNAPKKTAHVAIAAPEPCATVRRSLMGPASPAAHPAAPDAWPIRSLAVAAPGPLCTRPSNGRCSSAALLRPGKKRRALPLRRRTQRGEIPAAARGKPPARNTRPRTVAHHYRAGPRTNRVPALARLTNTHQLKERPSERKKHASPTKNTPNRPAPITAEETARPSHAVPLVYAEGQKPPSAQKKHRLRPFPNARTIHSRESPAGCSAGSEPDGWEPARSKRSQRAIHYPAAGAPLAGLCPSVPAGG